MKPFYLLLALCVVCGLSFVLFAQKEEGKTGGTSAQPSAHAGWQRVADPEVSNTGSGAQGGLGRGEGGRSRIPHMVMPLADGYSYTSMLSGAYRARSSDIENNPDGVVWTLLDGVPKSGGVSWRSLAWALTDSGDVVTAFAKEPKWSMVTGCPCGYYRLPKNTTKFVPAGGASPNGVVGNIVPDGKGRLYSVTGFGVTIQRTSDGGRTWSTAPGAFASNPYLRLTRVYGGLYGLAIINNEIYTGGEGGILKCDLDMKSCAEVAGGGTGVYKRNVTSFASNGGPQTPPTEIFELARQAPPTGENAGLSLMKWDSNSNAWNFVPVKQAPGGWYEAYVNAIWKLQGPHEYLLTRYGGHGSQLLYTNDAVTWTEYDTTGLDPFDETHKSLLLAVNPLSGAKYLMTSSKASADLWVHK